MQYMGDIFNRMILAKLEEIKSLGKLDNKRLVLRSDLRREADLID
ncbi:MAG: hypothetical protein QXR00_04495 [Candidatus Bathyarchaeia archaeon]